VTGSAAPKASKDIDLPPGLILGVEGGVMTWTNERSAVNQKASETLCSKSQWIGLRENLQETMVFTIRYGGFL